MTSPGYPLPDGVLGSDDIVCQLVYLPNKPEYWQALYGALSYMATWRAWERDTDKRGKDAASNWREALELTTECWRMTCLDDLKTDVAAILALMQIPQTCCDPGDVTDGDQYTDRVEDGVGDVPQNIIDAGYASGTSDWAGFDDYKCMISHVLVDQLEARLNEIAPLMDTTGAVLGGVAAVAGIMAVAFSTAGLAIIFGIVAGIGATSLLYQALTDFDWTGTLVDKVATNHDALACAVYNSDGDDDALSELNDKIDELFTAPKALILKNMNLAPTLKMLYAGRYDEQDIADILDTAGYDVGDFSCTCIVSIGDVDYDTFWLLKTSGANAWQISGSAWQGSNIDWSSDTWYTKSSASVGTSTHYITNNRLEGFIGLSPGAHDDIYLHTARIYLRHNGTGTEALSITIWYDDATTDNTQIPYTIGTSMQWQDITVDPTKKILKTEATRVIQCYTGNIGTPQNQYWVTRLEITGSYTVL